MYLLQAICFFIFSESEDPFYLGVVTHTANPREGEQWFLSAPIGRNKLNSLLRVMAEKAQLPELQFGKKLTNTSARKRLCQKLLQSNVPDTQAVLVTGHKNPASLNNYRVLTNNQQRNISTLLSNTRPSPSTTQIPIPDQVDIAFSQNVSNQNSSFVANNVPSFCLFSNTTITGGTFNITITTPTLPN